MRRPSMKLRVLLAAPVALAASASATLADASPTAGASSPLSAITALPALSPVKAAVPQAVAVPGVTLKTTESRRGAKWHALTATTARGYCFSSTEAGYRWMSDYGTSSTATSSEELDLSRVVEKDGTATLERTRLVIDPGLGTVTAKGRSTVALRELARSEAGVVVWAFREGKNVIVLARKVERGVESAAKVDDGTFPFVSADGCPYAGARLDARDPAAGSFVQLSGALPAKGTGKDKVIPRFMVDVSLSRVARDPEPMLAVRVRVKD